MTLYIKERFDMMYNKINEIQRQYLYAIPPVKLFEPENNKQFQKSSFEFITQMNFAKSGYNPFHPNVQTNSTANLLDIMG